MNFGKQKLNGNKIEKISSTYEGIRLIFNVEGIGKQFSFTQIVFLLTQLLSIVLLPKFIADIIFTNFMEGLFL